MVLFGVKIMMAKVAMMIFKMNLMKIIHIQLSNERLEAIMTEVFR